MRLAFRGTLLLLAIYLVFVGGVGWWMVALFNALASDMAETTAELVGGEVARALTDSALERFAHPDDATRAQLEQLVDQVTHHSGILRSLAVVDRNGTVIAGDNVEIGRQLALPEIVFATGPRARVVNWSGPFEPGTFFVMVPIMEGGKIAGYVRLAMHNQRIAQVYRRGTRNLLLVAVVGLILVGAAGLWLHVQLSRRSARLMRALEGALRDDGTGLGERRDEFSSALDVARRLGRDLKKERGGRLQAVQRMDALLKAVDVGVLMLEPDGGLGFASARAADLLGYTTPSALGSAWNDELRDTVAQVVDQPSGTTAGKRVDCELPPGRGAGRVRLESYELGEGTCEGYLVIVRSVESLDALHSELGLAMQMRGLTRFYAAFTHDLKAPLNAMVMTLELLKRSVDDTQEASAAREKQLAYVATLNQEVRRLDRQLRTLLTHTASPSEKRDAVDLGALLQELQALLTPQARAQGVALTLDLPEEPVQLVGWGDRLKQAMLNILINALEAMPDGGQLTMALARHADGARITVRDSGPGIPPELLASIYHMHVTTKSGGTGVGLYVARSVVQAHGGEIDVQSTPSDGTCFVLTLPLAA